MRLIYSFKYALTGLIYSIRSTKNMQLHIVAGILVVLASIYFQVNAFEMGILGVMILLVLSAEMINTAIEQMVDLITNEHRREAKIAKDVSAGMVLLVAFGSVVVGILVFAPHILKLLR